MPNTRAETTKNNSSRPITTCKFCINMVDGAPMAGSPPSPSHPHTSLFTKTLDVLYIKISPLRLSTLTFTKVSPGRNYKSLSKLSMNFQKVLKYHSERRIMTTSYLRFKMRIGNETNRWLFTFIKFSVNLQCWPLL